MTREAGCESEARNASISSPGMSDAAPSTSERLGISDDMELFPRSRFLFSFNMKKSCFLFCFVVTLASFPPWRETRRPPNEEWGASVGVQWWVVAIEQRGPPGGDHRQRVSAGACGGAGAGPVLAAGVRGRRGQPAGG